MRGRSSKQVGSKEGLDIEKLDNKLKQEPHLSGAYIRNLVKRLTLTKTTKDPMNHHIEHENLDVEGFSSYQNLTKIRDGFRETQESQPSQPPPSHKKQVRRRLHTSRPYQERLLNMAEARREIVTALKFHRASMKQANEQQQQQQQQQETELQPLQQQTIESRRNPRIYASNSSNNFTNYVDNFSYPNYPYSSWPLQPESHLNFALPNETLGLNLNLQDFSNLDNNFYNCANNPTIYSNLSSSSSSSLPIQVAAMGEVPNLTLPHEELPTMVSNGDLDFHHAVDDKEMAEIRSIGEQHQNEWNDTLNLVNSAWWFKFLKTMEIDDPQEKAEDFGHYYPFDEIMEFPSWLNGNGGFLEQHLSDYLLNDYMQDPALPCMEIEEIEGMDGEWLSEKD